MRVGISTLLGVSVSTRVGPQSGVTFSGSKADGLVQYEASRVFYCSAYEESVRTLPEFCLLQMLVDRGFNLLILGPDGHPLEVTPGAAVKSYSDASLQYGHERVLVAMLRGERPWVEMPRCWRECA